LASSALAALAAVIGLSGVAPAQVSLYELARFDLSLTANGSNAQFIGSNPLAVGWNGSKLYVAGFNSGTTTLNTAIIEVTNAASVTNGAAASGFLTPTYSSTFAGLSSPASRGYTGLAMQGGQLAASFDAGSNNANGIQMFNAATNVQSWNLSASGTNAANVGITRGMAGPDFDPGYLGISGSGNGLGWTTQGVGRRLLNDSTSGTTMYSATLNVPTGAAQGMIVNTNPVSTTWRDMAFNPATGDVYLRNQVGVTRTNRTGPNSDIGPTSSVAGQSDYIYINSGSAVSNNVGINIGFMNSVTAASYGPFTNSYSGDLLVFNDRGSTAAGQSWTNVIKFTTTSGSSITPSYTFLANPLTSTGAYDFEWDSATQTLAVLDYTNRNVSIFSTAVPEPTTTTMALVSSVGMAVMLLRRARSRNT
jgi:hypothetical protein